MIISFTLSLIGIAINFLLSVIGLKVALACLVLSCLMLCLIGAIAVHKKTNLSSAIKRAFPICGII